MPKDKKALLEAALFMSPDPLTVNDLGKITGMTSKRDLEKLLIQIKLEHELDTKGIELVITPEGYHFKVKEHLLDKVSSLTPHSDLSDGMLRTLGLVALRQPMRQSEIVKIQGNKTYGYIKKLENKGLIEGEKDGRTRVLRTTDEFERYFGKSLKDIQENLKSVIGNERNNQSGTEVPGQKTQEDSRQEDSENKTS